MSSDKRVLLVGAGADIGANILYLSATEQVQHPVTDILTNEISSQGPGSNERGSLDELVARIVQANPVLLGKITIDTDKMSISILDRIFRVHFSNFEENLSSIGFFDLAILATSRKHIRSQEHLDRLSAISKVVLGLAENSSINAIYPSIASSNLEHFADAYQLLGAELSGAYAMGSCQCAGWTVGLRVIIEYCNARGLKLQDCMLHSEVDIMHPDTASSNFGMKRIGARSEDPRDNMRPGISQVASSMRRFQPATSSNTVSLRILTQPPGYQIQRFFLNLNDVDIDDIRDAVNAFSISNPRQLLVANSPLGSRAYSATPSSTVFITNDEYLKVTRLGNELTEIVLQGFVHNTLGYCAAILETTDRILEGKEITIIT